MSSYYSDEEQVERLQQWWKDYGPSIVVGVVLGLALLGGYRYWSSYQRTQAEAASQMYEQLLAAHRGRQADRIREIGQGLIDNYQATPYAPLAALTLAKTSYEDGDHAQAVKRLEWAIANAASDATQQVARLRLANVLLEQGKMDEALKILGTQPVSGYESEYHETKGDVQRAKGQIAEAHESYSSALQNLNSTSGYRDVLQMKLDDTAAGNP